MNIRFRRTPRTLVFVAVVQLLSAALRGQEPATAIPPAPSSGQVVLPESVPDPLEPLNRIVWSFNKGVMTGVIQPTSWVYRGLVPKGVRRGIGNFGHNLTYPGRLINNLLQAKWNGARDESYRFLCNSTVGVAGFFDVATRRNIPRSDADFGQTFGQWGWKPNAYLMLPIFGPSNERDTLGLAADTAANPLIYISPYRFDSGNPLTYLGPYSYFHYSVMYNDLTDTVGEYVRFSRSEMDSYAQVQYAWTFARANRVADFQVKGERDEASLETVQSVFFTFKDPEFPGRGKTRSARIPSTGRRLDFTFWLQKEKAPVVYILPGLGAHRLAQPSLALAELVYNNGFSVVCLSSAFHSEFMEHASSTALPGFLPVDAHDVHVALTETDRRIRAMYPGRLGDRALMGYSMGGMHTMFLAADPQTNAVPLLRFDRYVAISSPVRLLHGVSMLDEYYRAPLDWPEAERKDNLENTFLKVAAMSKTTMTPQTSLPFNAIESRFLIGLTFRLILRDVIFDTQRRNNQGVLDHSIRNLRREPVYQEILQYSYQDYFEKLVTPYYQGRGLASPAVETLEKGGDLRTYGAVLGANPDLRVVVNQNDFLLADEDLEWLRTTVAPERLTVFNKGGHMGNLSNTNVQSSILGALKGLNAVPLPASGR